MATQAVGLLSSKGWQGTLQSSLLGLTTKFSVIKTAASTSAVLVLSSEGLLGFSVEQVTKNHGHSNDVSDIGSLCSSPLFLAISRHLSFRWVG